MPNMIPFARQGPARSGTAREGLHRPAAPRVQDPSKALRIPHCFGLTQKEGVNSFEVNFGFGRSELSPSLLPSPLSLLHVHV